MKCRNWSCFSWPHTQIRTCRTWGLHSRHGCKGKIAYIVFKIAMKIPCIQKWTISLKITRHGLELKLTEETAASFSDFTLTLRHAFSKWSNSKVNHRHFLKSCFLFCQLHKIDSQLCLRHSLLPIPTWKLLIPNLKF